MKKALRVWTKQHKNVEKILEERGRYTAKKEYIDKDLGEYAGLVLEVYDWLVRNGPGLEKKPDDAEYPVWLSVLQNAAMLPDENSVILELEIEEESMRRINIGKWGQMLNYGYIPRDEADKKRHETLLHEYGISDAQAYMSRFYPQIKAEIRESWKRLFDESIILDNDNYYGNIWEIRKEWVRRRIT